MREGVVVQQPPEPLARMLLAAINEAGLIIAQSPHPREARKEAGDAFDTLLHGLLASRRFLGPGRGGQVVGHSGRVLIEALVVASVALPPAHPPGPSLAGVRISWPVRASEASVSPGTRLTVRVSSSKRRARLSFARVSGSGRVMRVVARRTLRKGAFSLRVPASTVAARYALRIQVAGRKRWSWVTTPGPAPAAPVPAAAPAPAVATATPTPTPTIEPWSICGGHPDRPYSAFDAEVRLSATEATAGETLAYTLVNTGQYEVFDGGSHRLLPADHGYPDERGLQRAVRLDAGKSAAYEVTIPADTPAGRYRIWHELQINATCDVVSQRNTPSEPFDVLAPGEPEPTPTATPAER